MYFRDSTATITDLKQYRLWVALEAGSGIVSQHDYDPSSSCAGFAGCEFWSDGPCKPGAARSMWWQAAQRRPRRECIPQGVLCNVEQRNNQQPRN